VAEEVEKLELWNVGIMAQRNGIMEYWNDAEWKIASIIDAPFCYSIIPAFQFSNLSVFQFHNSTIPTA